MHESQGIAHSALRSTYIVQHAINLRVNMELSLDELTLKTRQDKFLVRQISFLVIEDDEGTRSG